jgi:hypothetical protein
LYLTRYQTLTKELSIHIVPGTIISKVLDPASQGVPLALENNAYLLAAGTGEVLGSYTKKNLWHPERDVLTPDLDTPHKLFPARPQ